MTASASSRTINTTIPQGLLPGNTLTFTTEDGVRIEVIVHSFYLGNGFKRLKVIRVPHQVCQATLAVKSSVEAQVPLKEYAGQELSLSY